MRAPSNIRGINWASPLAQGLKHAYIPRYGSMLDLGQERELLPHDATEPPSGIKSVDGIVMMNAASGGHVVDSNGTTLVGSSTDTNGYTAAGWAETPVNDVNGRVRHFFGAGISTRGFALGHRAHLTNVANRGCSLHLKHAGSPSVLYNGTNAPPVQGKAQLYAGTWTPGAGIRAYMDGVFLAANGYTSADTRMSSSLEIGQTPDEQNWTDNTYSWDGGVGPCFLWNRPLSDAEIRALYDPQTRWDIYDKGYRLITIGTADTTPPATDLTLEAQSGLVHVTGQSTSINLSRDLEATSGLVHVTGQSTSINLSRLLESTSGLVHLTGQDAQTLLSKTVLSQSALVHLAGQDVQVLTNRDLLATSGLVYIIGQDASITLSSMRPQWARMLNTVITVGDRSRKT